MNLLQLFAAIGIENLSWQFITECLQSAKLTKKRGTQLVLNVASVDPSALVSNTGKVGIIVWVDREKFDDVTSKRFAA